MAVFSEMQSGGYSHTELYKRIAEGYNKIQPEINLLKKDVFKNPINIRNEFNRSSKVYYACLQPFNNNLFNYVSNNKDIRVSVFVNAFQKSVSIFEEKWKADLSKEIVDAAYDMVESFQKLSTEIVFCPDSKVLTNVYLRYECAFLDSLICPNEAEQYSNILDTTGPQKYIVYDARDPFVAASLLNVMHQYSQLTELHNNNLDDILLDLRRSIFIRNAEKSHKRFLSINRKTMSVRLNRTLNSIIATPYVHSSSLESIKPIRLFEKISQYIDNYCKRARTKSIDINVCIIGYTELQYNSQDNKYEERELCDLGRAILRWIEHQSQTAEHFMSRNININITNLYNKYDTPRFFIPNVRTKESCECYECEDTKVSITAKAFDFDNFNYSTAYFTQVLMHQYDLLFIIDCPFLTEENFELKRDYSLKDYCNTIQRWNYFDIDNYPRLDKKEASPMMILNTQFNRIMSSNTKDAGQICRVFHDYWIADIQDALKHYNNSTEKVVYIFSSESDGVSHSSISNNPTSRTEQYEGKTFNIFRYSNILSTTLSCFPKSKKMELRISLWRMLKYASTEYAFYNFRRKTCLCLFGNEEVDFTNPIDLHVLYRNINVVIKERQQYKANERFILDIGIEYNKNSILKILNENNDNLIQNSIEIFFDYVKSFVYAMYTEVYFPKPQTESKFGDHMLREAFLMNIYSSSTDVWDMWFLHKYQEAMTIQNFDIFEVNCVKSVTPDSMSSNEKKLNDSEEKHNDILVSDFFMDKKLYDLLFVTLENSATLSPGLKNLLQMSYQYYATATDNATRTIENILTMYDEMVGKRDRFRDNCLECINNF